MSADSLYVEDATADGRYDEMISRVMDVIGQDFALELDAVVGARMVQEIRAVARSQNQLRSHLVAVRAVLEAMSYDLEHRVLNGFLKEAVEPPASMTG